MKVKKLILFIAAFLSIFSAICEPLIEEANLHLGKKYKYATHGPETFDCSGFTYYCYYTTYGIELSKSAKGQGYDDTYEKIESIEDLQIGDIVCFNTVSDHDLSDHVGIYLGNGEFVHASSGKGEVCISSLLEGYYYEHFSWAQQILKEDISNEARPQSNPEGMLETR